MLKKLFSISLLLAIVTTSLAQQNQKVQNKPYIDLRPFHYGFSFGLHQQSIIMPNSGYIDPETGQQWWVTNDNFSPGFTVGLIGEWRINSYLAMRVLPTMHFASNHLVFREQTTGLTEFQDMKSTYISVPLDFKLAAPRHNNYRPYVLAGMNASYNLTTKDQANIATKPLSLGLEVGLGCDYYLPFFKFCPELKFCFGFTDVLKTNRSNLNDKSKEHFTKAVKSAKTAMVVLTFHFE